MNLVDSCGWLEYLADGRHAGFYVPALDDPRRVLVPTVCLAEVFGKVLDERGEDGALQAAAAMMQCRVVDLDTTLSLEAARLGHELKLPLADSIVLATARSLQATVWT